MKRNVRESTTAKSDLLKDKLKQRELERKKRKSRKLLVTPSNDLLVNVRDHNPGISSSVKLRSDLIERFFWLKLIGKDTASISLSTS